MPTHTLGWEVTGGAASDPFSLRSSMKLELEMTSGGNTSAPPLWRLLPEREPGRQCWEAELAAPAVTTCPQQVPIPTTAALPSAGSCTGLLQTSPPLAAALSQIPKSCSGTEMSMEPHVSLHTHGIHCQKELVWSFLIG